MVLNQVLNQSFNSFAKFENANICDFLPPIKRRWPYGPGFETGFLASREIRRKGFSHAFPEMLVDVQFEQSPAVAPLHSEPKIAKMCSGPRARMASAV